MKTPQPVPVDGVLIQPHDLHDILLAGGAMPRKEGLIHQREPIILPHNIFGCGASKDARSRRIRTGTDQPPRTSIDSPVPPETARPLIASDQFITCRVADAMTTSGRIAAKPVALFVLGIGRSGTSALTRVLSLCGAALPPGCWAPLRRIRAAAGSRAQPSTSTKQSCATTAAPRTT